MRAYLPSTKGIYNEREAKVLLYDRDFSPHWLRGDNNMVCVAGDYVFMSPCLSVWVQYHDYSS